MIFFLLQIQDNVGSNKQCSNLDKYVAKCAKNSPHSGIPISLQACMADIASVRALGSSKPVNYDKSIFL